jgi:hypothetical protein
MRKFLSTLSVLTVLGLSTAAIAEQNVVKEAAQDTRKVVKKGVNNVKDATCETFNSKGECLVRKAGHKIENAVEEVKDKVN